MKPWREVARPHKIIREGNFDEGSFMVSFSSVIAGQGPVEYRDSQTFAAQTFPTQGLVNLLAAVVGRLAGTRPGEAVIELQTPFGGGKTHALVALYHLFNGHPLPGDFLQPILAQSQAEAVPPTKVVTFAGQEEDPLEGKTLWGLIAMQLGRYDLVQRHDTEQTSPGKRLLREVLGSEPTLLLMDEILAYALKAKSFQAQLMIFFQELAETVNELPHCALVYTLPTNQPYEEEGERLLRDLKQVLGRVSATHVPVGRQEINEIIRRRLFEDLGDAKERERTIENYWQLYQQNSADLPLEVCKLAYRELMSQTYPFHPQLIDLLYERWGSFYNFQRTRGVLQFLARVVADLYEREHSAPLIQVAHLNLANEQIKTKLTGIISSEYHPVIEADIVNGNAKAQIIDESLGSEYKRYCVASSLATAIFFGSFSGSKHKGLNKRELQLAILRDGLALSVIDNALLQLEKKLWFLHIEQSLYYFNTLSNPNRVILDYENRVGGDQIKAELEKRLKALIFVKESKLKVLFFPCEPAEIEDKATLQIVLLSEEYPFGPERTTSFVENLLNKHKGNAGRVYRNALLILAPDKEDLSAAQSLCKRALALQHVSSDPNLLAGWTKEVVKGIKQEEKDISGGLDTLLLRTYRRLARISDSSPAPHWDTLGLNTNESQTLIQQVQKRLREEDKLPKEIKPEFIREKVWPTAEAETEVLFEDLYARFFMYPTLPIFEGPDVLWQAVRKGGSKGLFGLRVEGELLFKKELTLFPNTVQAGAILVAAEVAEAELRAKEPEPVEAEGQAFSTPESALRRAKKTTPLTPQMLFDADLAAEDFESPPSVPVPVKRLTLRLRVSANSISELSKGILNPLKKEAEVELEVSIVANSNSSEGITRTTLNSIEESIAQNKIEVLARREN